MNSVSFGSTFKINHKSDIQKQNDVRDFCSKNNIDYSTQIKTRERGRILGKPLTKIESTIIVPDEKDNLIETYLANKGIKFKKLDTDELLSKRNIESRIERPPMDFRTVKVDANKLEELMRNQDQNISYCERNYEDYYRDDVDRMFKSGNEIPATSLHIIPLGESPDETVHYVKRFGSDRLNDNQLSFIFDKTTDDPDHCTYFGMRDLGMDEIPVYVDPDTYKIGKALELFS